MSGKDNEYLDIQQALFDYFEDVDNKTLSTFIEVFLFQQGTKDTKISKLIEKFLEDNGLQETYIHHIHDLKNPTAPWLKSSLSQRSMMDQINHGLLVLSYNRFRRIV